MASSKSSSVVKTTYLFIYLSVCSFFLFFLFKKKNYYQVTFIINIF